MNGTGRRSRAAGQVHKNPDTEEPLATGGKLGYFRSPEPRNGEAAPAIFGYFHGVIPFFISLPGTHSSNATLLADFPALLSLLRNLNLRMAARAAKFLSWLQRGTRTGFFRKGLAENIQRNRHDGRSASLRQFQELENRVMGPADESSFVRSDVPRTGLPPPGSMGEPVFREPDSCERMRQSCH
jgi:hypothetical protein